MQTDPVTALRTHAFSAGATDARAVAAQLAAAQGPAQAPQLSHARDGTIELQLSPQELGKVQMTIRHDAQVMTVTIHADRPETLDLMRRHSDVLAQEFRAQGYNGTAFAFAGGQGGETGRSPLPQPAPTSDRSTPPDPATTPMPATTARPLHAADGLDLRL